MSAPDTNIDCQVRRHKPSLWGIGLAIAAVGVFVLVAMTSDGVPADEQAAGVPAQSAVAD